MVRDSRKKDWFHIDNEIVDMNLGGLADNVYSKLCRHANNETGEAWPGLKKWADEKKFHYRDVSKALKLLIEKNLIEKSGRKGSQGPFIYTVLDVEKKRGIANRETPEEITEMSDFQNLVSDDHNGKPSDCHSGSRTKLKLNKTDSNQTKKKRAPKAPLSIPDDLVKALQDFNSTAGTEFVPDKGLVSLWSIAKRGWELDYILRALHNYAMSGWHRKKFANGQGTSWWNLRKFLMNRDGEIPKFYKENPPAAEGTGYRPIDLESSPEMSKEELDSVMGRKQ